MDYLIDRFHTKCVQGLLSWEDLVALKKAKSCLFWALGTSCLFGLVALLGQKNSLDVGQDTSLGDGHSGEKFVQFLVITDGQLQMPGDDPGLLVVTGSISRQLQNLSSQVLHHSSQVDWGTSSNSLSIVSLAEKTVDPSHGELETGTAGPGLALSLRFSSFSSS